MTTMRALFSFMQGEEAYRRMAARWFQVGVPTVRLHYLEGHPSIPREQYVWVGRVGSRLRLVGDCEERPYEIPVQRIRGVAYDPGGLLWLRFEPAAGLVATAVFRLENHGAASYQRLLHMVALSA